MKVDFECFCKFDAEEEEILAKKSRENAFFSIFL